LVGDFLDIDLRPHVGRFDFIYDQGCFHHIPPRERAQYAMRVHHLLTEDGVFFLRAFSDEMRASPAGDGPIRLSADDILSTFMPWFTVESMRRIDNIPLPYGDKPQRFWSFLGRRRIVGAPEHGG
jgi:cyclopropane fatty-acyl-phospholipid synthase-like methyltransferase